MLSYIDRLPRTSHYQHERLTDGELLTASLDGLDLLAEKEYEVPFTEWDYIAELLTYIGNTLAELYAFTVAANTEGHQMKRLPPLPRPGTTLRKLREMAEFRAYEALVAKVEGREPISPPQ